MIPVCIFFFHRYDAISLRYPDTVILLLQVEDLRYAMTSPVSYDKQGQSQVPNLQSHSVLCQWSSYAFSSGLELHIPPHLATTTTTPNYRITDFQLQSEVLECLKQSFDGFSGTTS